MDLYQQTLGGLCQTQYQYATSTLDGTTTISQLSTTTQFCYNPTNGFLIIGGLILGFIILLWLVIKLFK